MLSSNSPIDWTKFMNTSDSNEYVKTPEFFEWLKGLLNDDKPTTITFTKKDGTERVMRSTRNLSLIPDECHPGNSTREESKTAIRVFDLDKLEWRSFIVENVKHISYTF